MALGNIALLTNQEIEVLGLYEMLTRSAALISIYPASYLDTLEAVVKERLSREPVERDAILQFIGRLKEEDG